VRETERTQLLAFEMGIIYYLLNYWYITVFSYWNHFIQSLYSYTIIHSHLETDKQVIFHCQWKIQSEQTENMFN